MSTVVTSYDSLPRDLKYILEHSDINKVFAYLFIYLTVVVTST